MKFVKITVKKKTKTFLQLVIYKNVLYLVHLTWENLIKDFFAILKPKNLKIIIQVVN